MTKEEHLKEVEKGVIGKGKKELLKYLRGEKLTYKQAVSAYCYDCNTFYYDSRSDC